MAICVKCRDSYSERRASLGYKTCLSCGSPVYKPPIIPMTKSNYVVGNMEELRSCSYAAKGSK